MGSRKIQKGKKVTFALLPPEFFLQETLVVAKSLLGKLLIHRTPNGIHGGRIVETEAYLHDDPACHASRGMTPRCAPMFGPPGRAYVYFIYGNHYCFNVVTQEAGKAEAVLIRALEPLYGIPKMMTNRKTSNIKNLTSGPGKLCQALEITKAQNEWDLRTSDLFLAEPKKKEPFEVVSAPRIGITQATESPWRFYIKDNPHVSRK